MPTNSVAGGLASWSPNASTALTPALLTVNTSFLVVLGVGGAAMWLRFSMGRYLRYWLIRLIYEERQQTDDIVEALRGGEASEAGSETRAANTGSPPDGPRPRKTG